MTTDHGEEQESAQSQPGCAASPASAGSEPSAAVECLRALLALPLVQNSVRPLAEPWASAERIVEASQSRPGYDECSLASADAEPSAAWVWSLTPLEMAKVDALHLEKWNQDGPESDYAAETIAALRDCLNRLSEPPTWRPIESAPRDGTRVLVMLRDPIPARDRHAGLRRWDGCPFVARHTGGISEWCFAAPVGQGGFPDEWMAGWAPLPPPPVASERSEESSPRQVMPPIRDEPNLLHRSVLEGEGDTASVAKSGGTASPKSESGEGH